MAAKMQHLRSFLNKGDGYGRRRFTHGHELGHYIRRKERENE